MRDHPNPPNSLPKAVWLGAAVLAFALGLLAYQHLAPHTDSDAFSLAAGTRLPSPKPLPDFKLNSAQGSFTLNRLKGHYSLLYFGYTHCPDVCPATLAEMSSLYGQLNGSTLPELIFISVDPERDPVETLERYAQHFNAHFHGVTGLDAELMTLTQSVGALYSRDTDKDGRITVDHSSAIYLIDPAGRFTAVFTPPFKPELMARDLNHLLADTSP
jgi:protein SCO1/2